MPDANGAIPAPQLDIDAVRIWLNYLHGTESEGFFTVSWAEQGSFRSEHFPLGGGIPRAIKLVVELDARFVPSTYCRITPIREVPEKRKRGGADITLAVPALWADMDIAGPGHNHEAAEESGKLPLPPDEAAVRAIIVESGLPEPTIWIHSGGGMYPIWRISPTPELRDEKSLKTVQSISVYLQKIIYEASQRLGYDYGTGVSDLSRVLRIPGTVNRKVDGAETQCRILSQEGPQYTTKEFMSALNPLIKKLPKTAPRIRIAEEAAATQAIKEAGINPEAGLEDLALGGVSPGDDFNNKASVETVTQMLKDVGWTFHHEDSNRVYLARPGARSGNLDASVRKSTKGFWNWSESAAPFKVHRKEDGDTGETPWGVYTILHHGGDFRASSAALGDQGYGTAPPPPPAKKEEKTKTPVQQAALRSLDDIGNGLRFVDLYPNVAKFIGDEDRWIVWDKTRWAIDVNSTAVRISKAVAESMGTDQLQYLLSETGDQPKYPADYPAVRKAGERAGEPWMPHEWLKGSGPKKTKKENIADAHMYLFLGDKKVTAWYSKWAIWYQFSKAGLDLEAFADDCREMPRLNRMIASAQALPAIHAVRSSFDKPGGRIFVTKNVTIEMATGKQREHRREDMNTRMCPLVYDPEAKAPLFRGVMEKNFPDAALRNYIHKYFGYGLSGDSDQKILLLLHSILPDTGKSMILSSIAKAYGSDYAAAIARGTLSPRKFGGDGGRDPDRHAMMAKRLLIGTEFGRSEPMDEGFVKAYTGRDKQSTRGNYSHVGNVEWIPEGIIVIGTNKLFRIDLEDPAVWVRVRVAPMTVSFPPGHPDRDEDLERKIAESELEGILAWLVEGLKLYREEGLEEPSSMTIATAEYKGSSNHVKSWVMSASEAGTLKVLDLTKESGGDSPSVLFKGFSEWMKDERLEGALREIRLSTFKKSLEELGFEYKPLNIPGHNRGKRVMHGLVALSPERLWTDNGGSPWG